MLAADRILLLTYTFWMLGGCLLLFPGIALVFRTQAVLLRRSRAFRPFFSALGVFFCVFALSIGLFFLGLRDRVVSIDGTDVVISWGERFPITLHRYVASDLTNFVVTEEARFLVTTLAGSGDSTIRQGGLPNRWRVTAMYKGDVVDLGSYATEGEVYVAIEKIGGK